MERMQRLRMGLGAVVVVMLGGVAPARAQWTPVDGIPANPIYTIWSKGDTVLAGADTCAFVSTDAGVHWRATSRPSPVATALLAVRLHHGRLYAGTFGQGIFVSDDLGITWQGFNRGLEGFELFASDLVADGDRLIEATSGAGVAMCDLTTGLWQPFGDVFQPQQAPNVNSLAQGNGRLLAMAGVNGQVFWRDMGDSDWTPSNLDNISLHPGLQAGLALWTGEAWVVGTNLGLFHSDLGQEPWERFDPGLGPILWIALATSDHRLVVAFNTSIPPAAVIEESLDDGATWTVAETLPGVFVEQMSMVAGTLFAARTDGLWRRAPLASTPLEGPRARRLRLRVAGAQPIGDHVRLQFELTESTAALLEVFDISGRRALGPVHAQGAPGRNDISVDTGALAPGVYAARLSTSGLRESVQLVRTR
jgi:hypothetical protein